MGRGHGSRDYREGGGSVGRIKAEGMEGRQECTDDTEGQKPGRHGDWVERIRDQAEGGTEGGRRPWNTKGCRMGRGH